ncbi:PIN domain-containing protein [Sphingomonas psychrolutea]|uniref:PIN domain-containing protein n=1 Tax=Sphingomonas psychrolutea TaxID=1259676 RepID=A0ABQ1GAW6_9SPHN|nr:PIN domain-containing protein [Sphingomonas psychrolutea]GGA40150.1 hypothetical protein GCM10011395_08050 [Sphingomonas psychrolutea]
MSHRVIIDTNLLCLLAVGRVGVDWIARHKRLQAYNALDYELLAQVLGGFTHWVTTPHILAETSNLIRQTSNPLASLASVSLAELILQSDELAVSGVTVVKIPEYVRLGVTDAAILALLADGCSLVSVDFDLYIASVAAGHSAINFNHLREDAGLL